MEEQFEDLATRLITTNGEVERGKMMSSPGLLFGGKVFAFFWNDRMVYKLGKAFDPKANGIEQWEYLQPFRNKGPMKGWYVIADTDHWERLALEALQHVKKELG